MKGRQDRIAQEYVFMCQTKVTLGSLAGATKAGWLQKRGKNRKAWKTRYFVLSDDCLYYFKKANVRCP